MRLTVTLRPAGFDSPVRAGKNQHSEFCYGRRKYRAPTVRLRSDATWATHKVKGEAVNCCLPHNRQRTPDRGPDFISAIARELTNVEGGRPAARVTRARQLLEDAFRAFERVNEESDQK